MPPSPAAGKNASENVDGADRRSLRETTPEAALQSHRLPRAFYQQSVVSLARQLLGKALVHRSQDRLLVARIVETEAYLGRADLASHASKGLTARTEVLFGPPGHAYVYFIYGMYCCFNVVGGKPGVGGAVLVRGVEPLLGIHESVRTDGPGRLCRALAITLAQNREDLLGERLYLSEVDAASRPRIQRGPRVGVDYSGAWAAKPYRFWVRGNPFVS